MFKFLRRLLDALDPKENGLDPYDVYRKDVMTDGDYIPDHYTDMWSDNDRDDYDYSDYGDCGDYD